MPNLTTGATIEILFDKTKETYDHQTSMLPLVDFSEPDAAKMQNAGDVFWYPVQQHRPIIEGDDLTGQETGIIEEEYPSILGTLKNDYIKQTLKNMRDPRFWERAGEQSGKQQATELNKQIASAINIQGSLFYRSNDSSGLDFISEGATIQDERQAFNTMRYYMLNNRNSNKFAKDLGARQTIDGRAEEAWKKGQVGANISDYDVYTGSFLPNQAGGASPDTTCTGAQSFKPEAGTKTNAQTGEVTNVDYRKAVIVVAASGNYNVGDKVNIGSIKSLALADKTSTNQLMTFTIVAKTDATHITVYPKPIAADDATLTVVEASSANVDTTIANADVVTRLNIDASAKVNLFWDKSAVEVIGGALPASLFSTLDGMKTVTRTMENGLSMYLVYDGSIEDLSFRYRLFTWYGITVCNPSNCGSSISY